MKLSHDKNEINWVKLKVQFLGKEKNSLKTEINRKQDLVDSIFEYNSSLLRRQCCHFPWTDQINQSVGVSSDTNKTLVTT